MSSVARMIDANANRAREALRVMEDAARFALNDAALCEVLKELRHSFREAIDALQPRGGGWLEASRNTAEDVGTAISTASEMSRAGGVLDVVIAAGKRLTESLRVIEELSKTINEDVARRIESLRYRAYDLDAQLQLRFGTGAAKQWTLCVLLTQSLCRRPWKDVLRGAIVGGADCVQVREKGMAGGELLEHVGEVIAMARPAGVSVIVNDRADVALAAGADGVQVGQHDLSVRDVRRIAGRQLVVGVSTHSLDEARTAVEAGADYCGVGMMFPSSIKPDLEVSGSTYLRAFVERYPNTPHLAIGGITADNVSEIAQAGGRGVAVSTAVCAADDPKAATKQLRAAIESVAMLSA